MSDTRTQASEVLELALETALAELEQLEQQLSGSPPNADGLQHRAYQVTTRIMDTAQALALCDLADSMDELRGRRPYARSQSELDAGEKPRK